MIISIPEIPKSLNKYLGRKNDREYQKDKKDWSGLVQLAVNLCRDRPKEPYQKASVTITYYFPDKKRRDPDNYCGKMILDGLTVAGVIADDSFNHIELRLRGEIDKKQPRVEVEVEECI